jgi:hypothetical protein
VLDGSVELLGADGLGEVAVHAGGEAALAIALHGVGRHGDDGHMFARLPLALSQQPRGGEAVQLRHLHVHQHEVEGFAGECVQRFAAVVRNDGVVAQAFEQLERDLLVDGTVLGQQHVQPARRRGRGHRRSRLQRRRRPSRRLHCP